MEVNPKEFKEMMQSMRGEFIIHMEFGKDEPEDGAEERQTGSGIGPISQGCSDTFGA